MNASARLYSEAVIVGGLMVCLGYACLQWTWTSPSYVRLGLLLALSVAASTCRFRLKATGGEFSGASLAVLVAISGGMPLEVLATAALSGAMQAFSKTRFKPPALHVLFGMAALTLSAAAAFSATQLFMKAANSNLLLVLAIGSPVLFGIDTLLKTAVLGLATKKGVFGAWLRQLGASFPHQGLATAAAAALALFARAWHLY